MSAQRQTPNADSILKALRKAVADLPPDSTEFAEFCKTNLVIRMHFEDVSSQVTFDGRMAEVFWEDTPGRADLEMHLSSGCFHEVMTDLRSLRAAITDGTIRVKGNVFRALSFAELLRQTKPLYVSAWSEVAAD